MSEKTASSQAAWALLTCGVGESRVEAHRIRHLVDRLVKLANSSEHDELLYQYLGDVLEGLPNRIASLERILDKTSYALSKMGQDFLRGRIPIPDRTHVDEAVHATQGFSKGVSVSAQKVAYRHQKRVAAKKVHINRGE